MRLNRYLLGTALTLAAAALACNTVMGALGGRSGLPEVATAAAIATEIQDSGILATAGAVATAGVIPTFEAFGEAPPDIPIVEGDKQNFFGSKDIVSYFTPLEFGAVVKFYQEQMPANGWEFLPDTSVETKDAAVLNYEKPNRTAIVTVGLNPADKTTVVQILIQPK